MKKNIQITILFILFALLSFGCNMVFKNKKSQLYYQDIDCFYIDSLKIEKLNKLKLLSIVKKSIKKNILIVNYTNYCNGNIELINKLNVFLNNNYADFDVIYLVHDYLNNFENQISSFKKLMPNHTLYYTDKMEFGKGVNPIVNYEFKIHKLFFKEKIDDRDTNYYKNKLVNYKSKNVVFIFEYNKLYDTYSTSQMLDSCIKLNLKTD